MTRVQSPALSGTGRESEQIAAILRLQQTLGGAQLGPSQLSRRFVQALETLFGLADSVVRFKDGATPATMGCSEMSGSASTEGTSRPLQRCIAEGRILHLDGEGNATEGPVTLVALPLRDGSLVVGAAAVRSADPIGFGENDIQCLALASGVFAEALARAGEATEHQMLLDERIGTLRQLEESENRFRSAMNASRLGFWDWDISTNQVVWLGRHEEILGAPQNDGRYQAFLDSVHPEDRRGVGAALRTALKTGAEYSHVHRVTWPDGTIRWVMARGQVQYNARGAAVRMCGALMDVTERRVLEHQLLQAQKIEALGQLAAGIAHEINTPTQYVGDNLRFIQDSFTALGRVLESHKALVALDGGAQGPELEAARAVLAQTDIDFLITEIPRAAQQALDGVERVSGIVRAMKEFTHPRGDDAVPVDLNRLISNTASVARNEWKYVARLEFDLEETLPPVPCRPGEIQQVVLNLIVNAAHAIADLPGSEAPKGTITIRTRTRDNSVELEVCDTGVGIPKAARPRIFEPFFTTKEVGRGTGQGLSISRDVVVRKHRGTLTFRTEEGRGTTFLVRLPLNPPETRRPER